VSSSDYVFKKGPSILSYLCTIPNAQLAQQLAAAIFNLSKLWMFVRELFLFKKREG